MSGCGRSVFVGLGFGSLIKGRLTFKFRFCVLHFRYQIRIVALQRRSN